MMFEVTLKNKACISRWTVLFLKFMEITTNMHERVEI